MGKLSHKLRPMEFTAPFIYDNIKNKIAKVIRDNARNTLGWGGNFGYVLPASIPGNENQYLFYASNAAPFDKVESQLMANFFGQSVEQNDSSSGVQGSGVPASGINLGGRNAEYFICSFVGDSGYVTRSWVEEDENGVIHHFAEDVTDKIVPKNDFTYFELFKKFIGNGRPHVNVVFLYKVVRTANDASTLIAPYKDKIVNCGSVGTFYEICEAGLGLDKRFTLYYSITNQGVGKYIVNKTKESPEEIKFVSLSDYWEGGLNPNKISKGITQEQYFSTFGKYKIVCENLDVCYEYKDDFDSLIKIKYKTALEIQMYPGFLKNTKDHAGHEGIKRICNNEGSGSHNLTESGERLFLTYGFLEKKYAGGPAERAFKDSVLWFNTSRIHNFTSIIGLNFSVNQKNPFMDLDSWRDDYKWVKDEDVKGRVPFVKIFVNIKDITSIEKDGEEFKVENFSNILGAYDAFFCMTGEQSVRINSDLIKFTLEAFSKQKEFSSFVELYKKYFPYDQSDEIKGNFSRIGGKKSKSRIVTWVEKDKSSKKRKAKTRK